jgi:hypothetical protein
VVSHQVDDLAYHADLTGGQPGNEPAFMPAYDAARSRVGTQSAPV